ncbi:MAG: PqqD family protein [Bacteroidaceae bacterium]|nr:PqqD family protein [Bacteroidaceae bacterium]
MRIKEGFKMRPLLREHIVMAEGNVDFNKMISLNSTAAYLWDRVKGTDFDESRLVDILLEEYEVDRDVAERDVSGFVSSLSDAGLLEI